MTQNDGLVSPISVLYYQTYQMQADAKAWLSARADQIQVVASAQGWFAGSVPFGQTQRPGLSDYADGGRYNGFLEKL